MLPLPSLDPPQAPISPDWKGRSHRTCQWAGATSHRPPPTSSLCRHWSRNQTGWRRKETAWKVYKSSTCCFRPGLNSHHCSATHLREMNLSHPMPHIKKLYLPLKERISGREAGCCQSEATVGSLGRRQLCMVITNEKRTPQKCNPTSNLLHALLYKIPYLECNSPIKCTFIG